MKLSQSLRVAIIQTTLDGDCAWEETNPPSLQISACEEARAIADIGRGFADLYQNQLAPDVVILPELSVPRGYINELKTLAESLGALVVAGLDYSPPDRQNRVMNQGVLIVPEYWRNRRSTFGTTVRTFGKTYPADKEREGIEKLKFHFKGIPTVWVIDGHELGKIGVCICYDLLDLARLSMYRGHIQHLFVIAYNQDLTSFQHVAEAAMRTIFCNVVVCNTGKFGGSLAITPLHDPKQRIIYQQIGGGLFDCQIFDLSNDSLAERQKKSGRDPKWKGLPAGYLSPATLGMLRMVIKSKIVARGKP
jgi:predicted amidohydrolase